MTRNWWTLLLVLCALCAGCTSPPQAVQDSLQHQLQDFALCEAELIPLIPDDAVVTYTAIDGTERTKPARGVWSDRMRAFMVRGAGLLAWSRGEAFDPAAAFAKLFPDKVDGR